ncbi:MAG: ATP-binding protein [Candidatus Nealsonbacteria bacterium DGGOD1a]|nr:MAG: ATP-binding protein [Candidatus Nealsonbacteria bacterium DGGOD1a]
MYIKRKLEGKINKYLDKPEIIAIMGPRQCGKTTMLKKIFSGLSGANFISFEDRVALGLFNKNIDDFINLYAKNYKYLFIDEFQYSRNGGKKLKYIFDTRKIKILISGSSAIDLSVNAIKYLVGRIFIFNLYPFDFEEFLSYKDRGLNGIYKMSSQKIESGEAPEISAEIHNKFKKYFEEYAVYGGYPRVVISSDSEEKKEVLRNIYNTFFLREVKDVLGLIDDYKLEKLIKGLALQVGNLIDYGELGQLSEFSYPTLKRYMNFLEKTFVSRRILPYFKNKRTEIVKNPKIYFIDTGLRNQIVNDFRPFEQRGDCGQLLENAVFGQLAKKDYGLNYWRDKKKNEMDFILQSEGGNITAVEIKSKTKNSLPRSVGVFEKSYPDSKIIFGCFDSADCRGGGKYLFRPVYLF